MTVWLFILQVKDLVWLLVKIVKALYGLEWIWVLSLYVLEGFALFILVGRFLTVMRVTLPSRIWKAMWLLCMFFGLPFGHCVFSRVMVMGLFAW
jgi:hypothetical protein